MDNKVLQVIEFARLKVREGWCQGALGRDKYGSHQDSHLRTAVCVCTVGGIYAGVEELVGRTPANINFVPMEVWQTLYWALPEGVHPANLLSEAPARKIVDLITDWNDTHGRTQAEVLALFDRAIANLKEERHV